METRELVNKCEKELTSIFKSIDDNALYFSEKVLDAFHQHGLTEGAFNSTTGYGYNDLGRETIEKIYSDIFNCEDALVRSQFISGTHAISTALFACLRPNDILLSITGKPWSIMYFAFSFAYIRLFINTPYSRSYSVAM